MIYLSYSQLPDLVKTVVHSPTVPSRAIPSSELLYEIRSCVMTVIITRIGFWGSLSYTAVKDVWSSTHSTSRASL